MTRSLPGAWTVRWSLPAATAVILAIAVVVTGCGSGTADAGSHETTSGLPASPAAATRTASAPPVQSGSAPASASPSATMLNVYYLLGGRLVPVQRSVPRTVAVARAAVQQLLAGPTRAESAGSAGLSSAIPNGSRLLGVAIAGGTATVDLSGEFQSGGGSASMLGRLAQVLYTLTQFPTVTRVALQLDGRPATTLSGVGIVLRGPSTRADYRDALPAIFIDDRNPERHGLVWHRLRGLVRRDGPLRGRARAARIRDGLRPVCPRWIPRERQLVPGDADALMP